VLAKNLVHKNSLKTVKKKIKKKEKIAWFMRALASTSGFMPDMRASLARSC